MPPPILVQSGRPNADERKANIVIFLGWTKTFDCAHERLLQKVKSYCVVGLVYSHLTLGSQTTLKSSASAKLYPNQSQAV